MRRRRRRRRVWILMSFFYLLRKQTTHTKERKKERKKICRVKKFEIGVDRYTKKTTKKKGTKEGTYNKRSLIHYSPPVIVLVCARRRRLH